MEVNPAEPEGFSNYAETGFISSYRFTKNQGAQNPRISSNTSTNTHPVRAKPKPKIDTGHKTNHGWNNCSSSQTSQAAGRSPPIMKVWSAVARQPRSCPHLLPPARLVGEPLLRSKTVAHHFFPHLRPIRYTTGEHTHHSKRNQLGELFQH